jgi:hypothetical protein
VTEPAEIPVRAWQPFTPRGAAAFARAPLKRLLLVQLVFAFLLAAAIVWFLYATWFSTIHNAIRRMPARGEIRSGKLEWPAESPQLLAEGHFLALIVDLDHAGRIRSPAHVEVEFGRRNVRVLSLLGYRQWSYPDGQWIIGFNRTDLEPWWGAWQPALLAIAATLVIIGSMAGWALLATIYTLPAWLVGFYANRDLDPWKTWKLCGAALMPGVVLLIIGILLYGTGALDVVQLMAVAAAHVVVGLICAIVAAASAPRLGSSVSIGKNPFAGSGGPDSVKVPEPGDGGPS